MTSPPNRSRNPYARKQKRAKTAGATEKSRRSLLLLSSFFYVRSLQLRLHAPRANQAVVTGRRRPNLCRKAVFFDDAL